MKISNEQNFDIKVNKKGETVIKLKVNENINTSLSDIDSLTYHTPDDK